ncbi:MAG: cation transporter [Flammeovirgaceae bacterium]
MNTYKFKTSIKCEGCVSAVKNPLNEAIGADNWAIDLANSDKILTVQTTDSQKVIETLKQSGYQAELIS